MARGMFFSSITLYLLPVGVDRLLYSFLSVADELYTVHDLVIFFLYHTQLSYPFNIPVM